MVDFPEPLGPIILKTSPFSTEKEIPLRCEKTPLAVPDTYIKINSIEDNQINFDVFFFDEPTNITLKLNETSKYQKEGNAFAFEITFTLEE